MFARMCADEQRLGVKEEWKSKGQIRGRKGEFIHDEGEALS